VSAPRWVLRAVICHKKVLAQRGGVLNFYHSRI